MSSIKPIQIGDMVRHPVTGISGTVIDMAYPSKGYYPDQHAYVKPLGSVDIYHAPVKQWEKVNKDE